MIALPKQRLRPLLADSVVASSRSSGGDAALDRPVQRATAFVPRLGKRENTESSESRLCALLGLDCLRTGQVNGSPFSSPMATLARAAYQQGLVDQGEKMYELAQFLRELHSTSGVPSEGEIVPLEDAPIGKRVVFTPRIGR